MKLSQFEIFDYQCIRASNPVGVGDITCLLGKNEAGKTALLKALYKLNPVVESDGNYDVVDQYPRGDVEDYEYAVETGEREPATVARAVFDLEDADLDEVQEMFGNDVLNSPTLTLSKGYDNNRNFFLDVNQDAAFKAFVKNVDVPSEIKSSFYECFNFGDLLETLQRQPQHAALAELTHVVRQVHEQGLDRYLYLAYLRPRLPRFLYFDDYYQLKGYENLDALKQRVESGDLQPSDHAMLGLLHLARLEVDQLLNPRRTQLLINKLEGAGMNIGKRIFKYWSQNKTLQVKFDVRPANPEDPGGSEGGTYIWASVFDPYHSHSTLLGSRSRGFVWFFSFLAWYSQLRNDKRPLILLLDEPGQSLHGRAQNDLLRFFEEELLSQHQLVYTTHSPYMINPKRLDRVRIVEDRTGEDLMELPREQQGTKVIANLADASAEALLPLDGMESEAMEPEPAVEPEILEVVVPVKQLLVEDVADLLYLRAMSNILAAAGLRGLGNDWVVIPIGGIENIPTYLTQDGNSDEGLAILIGTRSHDEELLKAFQAKQLIEPNRLKILSDFAASQEAAMEDLFDVVFYTNLVNAAYRGYLSQPISPPNLNSPSVRLRDRVTDYLNDHPLQGGLSFNHRRPARLFAENSGRLANEISPQTRERFRNLFTWLSDLESATVARSSSLP